MQMIKTHMKCLSMPKGTTEVKIVEKDWGIERCYVSPDGEEICTPAPFFTNNRKLNWSYLS